MNFKVLWIKFEKFTTVITFKKFERHNYGLVLKKGQSSSDWWVF